MMKSKQNPDRIRSLSGIDALYYQVIINKQDYSEFYHNVLLNEQLDIYSKLERKSSSFTSQYVNYQLLSGDPSMPVIATIRFKNINEKDGLEPISIQHNTTYMNIIGYEKAYHNVIEFIESLSLQVLGTKIQRIDLNSYLFGYDLDFIGLDYFATLSRKNSVTSTEHYNLANKETFTLGSRDGKGVYMRIYDKRAELIANDTNLLKQSMIEYRYLMRYDENIDLMQERFYNIEFELKREALKKYGFDTVEDVLSLRYNLMKDIMEKRIRMLSKKKVKQDKNTHLIDTHKIWELVLNEYLPTNEKYDIKRLKQKRYTHDNNWLYKQVEKYLIDTLDANERISAKIQILKMFKDNK